MPPADAVLIEYPITENEAERKQRIKLGLPLKTWSYTAERENGPTERKRSQDTQNIARVPSGFDNAYSADDR